MRSIVNKASLFQSFKLFVFFAITSSVSIFASAEVYKWVDKNGNTHYSDRKPKNTQSQSIHIKKHSPSIQNDVQSQAKALDEKEASELQAKQVATEDEARKKEIEEKCAKIRKNLKVIAESSRIRIVENGEVRYLSPEEVAKKKAHHQAQIAEFCQ